MVSEKKFFEVVCMVGKIYVGDYLTLLHTIYLSSEPYGFREEDFLFFSIRSLWELMSPGAWPIWTLGAIYLGDHLALLDTKYLSYGHHGFREEVV